MREKKSLEAVLAEALAEEAAPKTDLEPKPEPEEVKVEGPYIYEPTNEMEEDNEGEEKSLDSKGNTLCCKKDPWDC
jgi:hypothetical protein